MKARARIVARAQPDGTTRLVTLAGETPLLLRRAPHPDGLDTARVHLLGGASGPIGGDDLAYRVDLGPGARVQVRSVAASLALPGPGGAQSTLACEVEIAAGGSLDWRPEPVIAVRGANHSAHVAIEAAEGAALFWRQDVVLGREDEESGSLRSRLRIRRAGRVVFDHEFALGPRYPGSLGPAGSAGYRRLTLTAELAPEQSRPSVRLALSGADLPELSHAFTPWE
jgi:urease accessory protein